MSTIITVFSLSLSLFYRFILICEIEATSVKNEQPQNYMSLICGVCVCVCLSIPATQNTIRQIQIEVSEQKQSNETTGKIGKKFFVFEMREKKIYVTSRSQPNEYSERGAQCARDRNQKKKIVTNSLQIHVFLIICVFLYLFSIYCCGCCSRVLSWLLLCIRL